MILVTIGINSINIIHQLEWTSYYITRNSTMGQKVNLWRGA